MTEYAHKNYTKCVTTSPSKDKCNATYRKAHSKLNATQIHTCDQYLEDMKYYIERFGETIFDASVSPKIISSDFGISSATGSSGSAPAITGTKVIFYFASPSRGSEGTAEIGIHLGHSKKRPAMLLKGSKISLEVSDSFAGSASVKALRAQLEKQGILVNGKLTQDYLFPSQSGAGQFLNGTSFDGNRNWKMADGTPLKAVLE